jgi:hypothetical protein
VYNQRCIMVRGFARVLLLRLLDPGTNSLSCEWRVQTATEALVRSAHIFYRDAFWRKGGFFFPPRLSFSPRFGGGTRVTHVCRAHAHTRARTRALTRTCFKYYRVFRLINIVRTNFGGVVSGKKKTKKKKLNNNN